ncbi:MAG TPA: aldo/keto reductase [Bryobacteraceae bacterium]|jgi:aryl-alcohol dehydrogenase (NADP+)
MKFTTFGRTGITVSRLCLGCMSYGGGDLPAWATGTKGWHVDREGAREHFALALESGINFFDTADVYSVGRSEEITGAHLKAMAKRDDIVVATKVHGAMGPGPNRRGLSRKHIIEACENSLRRLQMDYVDLYQIHRWDSLPALEEILDALDSLVQSGKVRYLGASSMAAWQLSKALYTAKENGWHRFVSMQNHYNLVYREEEREMIPLCMDQGLAVIPWSPLARGFLTGTRQREGGSTVRAEVDSFAKEMYYSEADFQVADAVAEVAKNRGVSAAQVACAWVLQAPGVTAPIIGATKTHHLKDVIGAVDLQLTPEEIATLKKPYIPHKILGHAQPTPEQMRR